MRKIKFRGKRLDNGEWAYGHYAQVDTDHFTIFWFKDDGALWWADVNPETLGQFTGLLDKNGKEIYEGDIITVNGKYPRAVYWDKMAWSLMPTDFYYDKTFWVMNLQHPGPDWWELFADGFEVIGNIHDNPEMLEGGGL